MKYLKSIGKSVIFIHKCKTTTCKSKMNGRFQHGYCIRFAGPSQCGKTFTLCKLLASKEYFCPCPPKRVMWVSGSGEINKTIENKVLQLYPLSQFFYHVPEEIPAMVREYDFWVFDDMASELKNNMGFTNFFTKTAHHKNCLMAYLTQNAYEPGLDSVTRSRNCMYQVYFNNKADCRWIRVLGDQLTGNHKQFANMFKESTKRPYDCLLCDNRTTTPPIEQFIGNAFTATEDDPTYFLVPHK